MKLALSSNIREIDKYCAESLGLSVCELMGKSGNAVASVIRSRVPKGKSVVFLAGKGNNGGDAYAAACELFGEYRVMVYDVFSAGQRSNEGKYYLSKFKEMGGDIRNYDFSQSALNFIKTSNVIVDAVFGTGLEGEIPEELRALSVGIREAVGGLKIAIDVPLGINADNGSVSEFAVSVDITVELSFIKPGIISYPARSYVGEIVYNTLGLPIDKICDVFNFSYSTLTKREIFEGLPKREENSNKSSFGKLLMISGSKKYRGAAHLSAEAALRSGVGYVNFFGEELLVESLSQKFPEIIYKKTKAVENFEDEDFDEIVNESQKASATLIGPGSDNTDGLLSLTLKLLSKGGGALVLDADAINALAGAPDLGRAALKASARPVILTPHPLEFARLAGYDVAYVQQNRLSLAVRFAEEYGVILVLKGAGTIVTDGKHTMVNSLGSSALAKAGSGDVLSGLLASLVAQKQFSPMSASCFAVALHALGGDNLAKTFSTYGVTPSDLPREIARVIAEAQNTK